MKREVILPYEVKCGVPNFFYLYTKLWLGFPFDMKMQQLTEVFYIILFKHLQRVVKKTRSFPSTGALFSIYKTYYASQIYCGIVFDTL